MMLAIKTHIVETSLSCGLLLVYLSLVTVGAFAGCNGLKSRYAMDDAEYARKYHDGAKKSNLLGKAKQAVDARHVKGLSGLYASGGAQSLPHSDSAVCGMEVGYEHYQTCYLSHRLALGLFGNDDQGYGGIDMGSRLQTPTRLAPFIGAGIFNGISRGIEQATDDRIDNDDDYFIDEPDEVTSTVDGWLTALYPEVGAHFWANGQGRVTCFGRYLISTEGRSRDGWLIGGQVTIFSR